MEALKMQLKTTNSVAEIMEARSKRIIINKKKFCTRDMRRECRGSTTRLQCSTIVPQH